MKYEFLPARTPLRLLLSHSVWLFLNLTAHIGFFHLGSAQSGYFQLDSHQPYSSLCLPGIHMLVTLIPRDAKSSFLYLILHHRTEVVKKTPRLLLLVLMLVYLPFCLDTYWSFFLGKSLENCLLIGETVFVLLGKFNFTSPKFFSFRHSRKQPDHGRRRDCLFLY